MTKHHQDNHVETLRRPQTRRQKPARHNGKSTPNGSDPNAVTRKRSTPLTNPEVADIRQRAQAGESIRTIAASLGRPYVQVFYCASGRTYGHLNDQYPPVEIRVGSSR